MTYTVRHCNTLTGGAFFSGRFETEAQAKARADEMGERSRKFARFEVWTGTPSNPGTRTGYDTLGVL